MTFLPTTARARFDFGWRWRIGDSVAEECSAATKAEFAAFDGQQCWGLTDEPTHAGSADACLDACCADPTCAVWTYGYRAQQVKASLSTALPWYHSSAVSPQD